MGHTDGRHICIQRRKTKHNGWGNTSQTQKETTRPTNLTLREREIEITMLKSEQKGPAYPGDEGIQKKKIWRENAR